MIIVSAFITNVNNRVDYSVDKYIENGKKLINLKIPKIIFLEKDIYIKYFSNEINDYTQFVMFEKEEIYLYEYENQITNFDIFGDKNKDTLDYIFVQCQKTEWIKEAININKFTNLDDQFVWIDFGIYYIIKDINMFELSLMNIPQKKYSNIRIAHIWDLNYVYTGDIYRNVVWYFAGSVFGGNKDFLIKFADLMKDKCISIINEHKSLMWEVNIWYMIYKEHPYLFDSYLSNHNLTLLSNY